jgi:hypothetical protein
MMLLSLWDMWASQPTASFGGEPPAPPPIPPMQFDDEANSGLLAVLEDF